MWSEPPLSNSDPSSNDPATLPAAEVEPSCSGREKTTWGALARMLLEAAGTGCGAPGALGGMWRTWRAWVSVTFGERLGIVWVSVTFGERLGIAWVSVTFGELLLHWAGSERRPGDGSSGAGHPERGVRGASAPRLTPLPGCPRAAPAAVASAFLRIACPSNS